MKRKMFLGMCVVVMIFAASQAYAGVCASDSIVKRWVAERNGAADRLLQAWARGTDLQNLMSDIAVILSNEFLMCSKCRHDTKFLEEKLVLLSKDYQPQAATVPAIILAKLLGYDILSPWRQFPPENDQGVQKNGN